MRGHGTIDCSGTILMERAAKLEKRWNEMDEEERMFKWDILRVLWLELNGWDMGPRPPWDLAEVKAREQERSDAKGER